MTRCALSIPAVLLLLMSISSSFSFQTRVPFRSTFHRDHIAKYRDSSLRLGGVEMASIGAALDEFFRTQPFLSAFVACSVKASAADFLAQTSVDADSEDLKHVVAKSSDQGNEALQLLQSVNMERNFAFLLYGGLYQGMFLQFLYMVVYPALYEGSDFRIPLSIFSDICVFGPFVTLPVAYIIRAIIESRTAAKEHTNTIEESVSLTEPVQQAIEKYKNHVLTQNLLFKYWMLWAPAQTINWCFVPEHLRVFFVAFISFFWVYLLSSISSLQTGTVDDSATIGGSHHHHYHLPVRPRTQSL